MTRSTVRRLSLVLVALTLAGSLTACMRYRVRDMQTGAIYYAKRVHEKGNIEDSIRFVDAVTGYEVVLTQYETEKISKKLFKQAVARRKADAN